MPLKEPLMFFVTGFFESRARRDVGSGIIIMNTATITSLDIGWAGITTRAEGQPHRLRTGALCLTTTVCLALAHISSSCVRCFVISLAETREACWSSLVINYYRTTGSV